MIMISPKFPEHGIRGFVCGGHTHLHDPLVEGEHSHEHVHEKGGHHVPEEKQGAYSKIVIPSRIIAASSAII